jgi:hypothetical protein
MPLPLSFVRDHTYPCAETGEQVTNPTTSVPAGSHTVTVYKIEKVPTYVGFDEKGNPRYEMKYDVVQHKVEVPNKK